MKQLSILFLSVILFSCSESEIKYHIDEVSFPNDTLTYLKSDMSLLNGNVYSEFGELGEFTNGEREGRHKRWYENGKLKSDHNWKNGKREGRQKKWYENGQLNYDKN
jgi:antitoxin component YwqK of YwqJK toxin-antitoxin module